jgi:HAE1 family hydrophobic/amphiphilic exporter-1
MAIIPAIEKAAEVRTRPILLTVLTAMIALFPIALGIGIGSQIQQSLAISIIGGLLASIFFTLNVLPLIYGMFHQQQVK